MAILLAKQRLILVLAALGYVVIRLAVALIFVHDWRTLLAFLLSGGALFTLLCSRVLLNWKPSYASERGLHLLDLIVVVSGLGLAIVIVMWIKP